MPTDHNIRQLIINKMTDAQYEQAVKSADELYLTPDTGGGGGGSGTVTSVRVQAGTGLTSSQSTAQTQVLNTTISIASGYKLPTTTEWNNKQNALPSQSGQSGKFLTTDGSTMSWATASGGTSNYNDLTNKPSINSITLSGDKTGSDLGLVDEADLEEIDINNLVPDQTGNNGKALITNGATVSWGAVSSLPDQTGNNGKFLTTNGTTASWATVHSGSTKFLSFENVSASTWVADNTYTGYGYKCVLTCTGVQSTDYAQVIFGPAQSASGDYTNVCLTGTNTVTIYSKVNTAISIPTIFIIGEYQ